MNLAPRKSVIISPAQREHNRVSHRERYYDRKARQVCVVCEEKLEEDDGIKCAVCEARHKVVKAIYAASAKGKAVHNRRRRNRRRARAKNGRCTECPRGKAEKGALCLICYGKRQVTNARYQSRRSAGIVSLAVERKRRQRLRLEELRAQHNPVTDLEDRPLRDRILVVMRFRGWCDPMDILDAAKVGRGDARKNLTVVISRDLMRDGYIERRVTSGYGLEKGDSQFEYRLTAAGRATSDARRLA